MTKRFSKNNQNSIAATALREAEQSIENDKNLPGRSVMMLTRSELEEMNLLCFHLGLGRDACLSSATKYCCSVMSRSNAALPAPKLRKGSRSNPKETVDYKITAEAAAGLRKTKSDFPDDWPANEPDFVRAAVAVLAKKLLPPKTKRR